MPCRHLALLFALRVESGTGEMGRRTDTILGCQNGSRIALVTDRSQWQPTVLRLDMEVRMAFWEASMMNEPESFVASLLNASQRLLDRRPWSVGQIHSESILWHDKDLIQFPGSSLAMASARPTFGLLAPTASSYPGLDKN